MHICSNCVQAKALKKTAHPIWNVWDLVWCVEWYHPKLQLRKTHRKLLIRWRVIKETLSMWYINRSMGEYYLAEEIVDWTWVWQKIVEIKAYKNKVSNFKITLGNNYFGKSSEKRQKNRSSRGQCWQSIVVRVRLFKPHDSSDCHINRWGHIPNEKTQSTK